MSTKIKCTSDFPAGYAMYKYMLFPIYIYDLKPTYKFSDRNLAMRECATCDEKRRLCPTPRSFVDSYRTHQNCSSVQLTYMELFAASAQA